MDAFAVPRVRPWRAAAAVTLLVGALAALAAAVASGYAGLARWDARLGEALAGLAATPLGPVLSALSALHAPRAIVVWTAFAALLLWRARDRAGAAVLLVSVLGGAAINHGFKHAFQRPRPGLEQAVAIVTDYAFPSGHVANATLLYGTLAALVAWRLTAPAARAAAWAAASLLVLGIACSRVMLGAHHASDVVAGALVGAAWATACLTGYRWVAGPAPR